jgi:hypothetical protein
MVANATGLAHTGRMALRQIAQPFDDYDGLVAIVRARLSEVGSTCEEVSDLAGLTTTHLSKLVNVKKTKLMGRVSLSCILQVLGLKLVAVVDDRAFVPLQRRLKPATYPRWNRPSRPEDEAKAAAAAGREMTIQTRDLGAAAVAKPRRRREPPGLTRGEGLAGAI